MKASIFDKVLTVQEVAERYGMSAKYVLHVLWRRKAFREGVDCALKGNTWLILATAADRLWRWRTIPCPPGSRVCRKCMAVLPEDEDHFKRYSSPPRGLTHTCLNCLSLQNAAWYQRSKARLRPVRTEYMRIYRREYPERNTASCKRYKLKRALKRVTR